MELNKLHIKYSAKIELCENGHQTVNNNISYKDEAEEETYGIFHCYRLIRLTMVLTFYFIKNVCQIRVIHK